MSAVSILVQDLEDQAASPDFARFQQDAHKQAKLRSLIDGIIYALRELEDLATKYSSLSTAKKNNWDRLRFASKSIDDIRARLILHTSAAQTILDGLTNRGVARIERKSDQANATLTRIEQVLADIVKDIQQGSRNSSVVSDERWNIWTELKRELRSEGFPVEVVQVHKAQIKQYIIDLLHHANIHDESLLEESDLTLVTKTNSNASIERYPLVIRSHRFWLVIVPIIFIVPLALVVLKFMRPALVGNQKYLYVNREYATHIFSDSLRSQKSPRTSLG